ncbi:hypothetical protein DL96DRAFT_1812128 [Flagelloscypha sp. PMI_526]|nr:hypothetical protein DL96DRAFT_1812128 [Flagelloscypha sp. PMI_526]
MQCQFALVFVLSALFASVASSPVPAPAEIVQRVALPEPEAFDVPVVREPGCTSKSCS